MPRDYQDYIETPDAAMGGLGGRLWASFGDFGAFGSMSPLGNFYSEVEEPARFAPSRPILPAILLPTPVATVGDSIPATIGPEEVSPEAVIDPEFRPAETVYEDAPGGIYDVEREETDWAEFYRRYVVLNPPAEAAPVYQIPATIPKPEPEPVVIAELPVEVAPVVIPEVISIPEILEEEPVAQIDWGQVAGQFVGGVLDPFGAGAATTSFFAPSQPAVGAPGGSVPAKVTVDTRTGQVTVCRRRRRRRLLTSSDLADIAALKAIIGGGAALNSAVVKAVRR